MKEICDRLAAVRETLTRSPLIWVGAKRRYLEDHHPLGAALRRMLRDNPDAEWREGCCGGAIATLRHCEPGRRVWLNDKNKLVACFWTALLRWPDAVIGAFERAVPNEALFYRMRDSKPARPDGPANDVLRTGIYCLLCNRWSFGHRGRRFHDWEAEGRPYANRLPFAVKVLRAAAEKLARLRVRGDRCYDWDVLNVLRFPGESVNYIDPTYVMAKRQHYDRLMERHYGLSRVLMDGRSPFVLSYDWCGLVRGLYGLPDLPGGRAGRLRWEVYETRSRLSNALLRPSYLDEVVIWRE